MTRYCYLCNEHIAYFFNWNPICDECQKIRKLIQLYNRESIINILNEKFLVKELKNEMIKQTKEKLNEVLEEEKDIDKLKRSKTTDDILLYAEKNKNKK